MKVKYTDLVGIPYLRGGTDPREGLDCRTLAFLLARRMGFQGLPEPSGAEAACFQWIVEGRSPCELLGRAVCDARELGDIVLTDSSEAEAGALVLVDDRERLFLTASQQRGRVVAMPSRMVERTSVIGVYRWVVAT